MNEKPDSRFIFGAEIQYFRTEPRYWKGILQQLKDTGIKCVTTYVQWSTHLVGAPDDQHPAGVLDFTGMTDGKLNLLGFLGMVEEMGLDLNFRCGPFCCNEMVHGGYPSWLVMGDPGIMVWDYQNRTTQGYWIGRREGSQPSYLHPDYLKWCDKWIAEIDKIIVPHLKVNGGCITLLNLDNEVSYICRDSMLESDYNPVNVRKGGYYHIFLQEKYAEVGCLPYGRAYPTFSDVDPPRSVPESVGADLAWYLDWMEFKEWCMCRYIGEIRAMHEKNGVKGVIFMTNFNPHLPEGVPTRMPSFEKATRGIAGYDFYRGTFMSYSGYQSMARVLKLMNASLEYTWSAEFMSGTWEKKLSSRVSDDHMRFMARCALSHGCKAIAWFMFADRACWGDAPVSSHSHRRSSWEVLRETIDICFNRISDWDALIPQTDAAIIYDLVQHRHTTLGDPSPCNDGDVHVGSPEILGTKAGIATKEYMGLFRLIEQAGYQPGVVDIVAKPELLNRYGIAFLPGSPVIERSANEEIRQWVVRGGTLVVSGAWPMASETGKPLAFLDMETRGTQNLGHGGVVWHEKPLAAFTEPEQDDLTAIACISGLLSRHAGSPHVGISPETTVKWEDWKVGGGVMEYVQPRNLGSAILQAGPAGERVLFVLNHYPDAVRFNLTFKDPLMQLICLDTMDIIDVKGKEAVLDIDRKSGMIYKVV